MKFLRFLSRVCLCCFLATPVLTSTAHAASPSTDPSTTSVPEAVASIRKTADAGDYRPGDTVTYTVEVAADSTATTFNIDDLLDDVVDDATYNGDATVSTGKTEYHPGAEATLNWEGTLAPGKSATLTYSITVNGKGNKRIGNVAVANGSPDTECSIDKLHPYLPGGGAKLGRRDEGAEDIQWDKIPAACKVVIYPRPTVTPTPSSTAPHTSKPRGTPLATTGSRSMWIIGSGLIALSIGGLALALARRLRRSS